MLTRPDREKLGVAVRKAAGRGAAVVLTLGLAGCEMPLALDPRGPAARGIADIWWVLFWTALVITAIVFALLAVALRRRAGTRDGAWPASRSDGFVLVGGAVVPTIVLVGVTILTFSGLRPFDRPPQDVALTIDVTGHMFWWEADYEGFTTANEIYVPVGRPVRVNLESNDVIHSFWVPQLAGKIEMIPGWTNVLYLEADEPGQYLGKCAEFCGVQHARMEFLVVALEEEDFVLWFEGQSQAAREPTTTIEARGREVFLGESCSQCHTIRGVGHAVHEAGPDLTHVGSRLTLAARTLPNTEGALAGWIADPQGVKPGNEMPAVALPSEDLLALVAYLRSLE